ncbi:MAG TPA: DEAD/DEAH box helicase [Methanocorpusculum sp.]|nr:DEAD/DEAH box helicase [Methanocorpusculum sp.]
MSVFEHLHPTLQETLITGLGWNALRPVQETACKEVAAGKDILVLAPTAGGKTEAAFLPVIDALLKRRTGHLSAIYVSPLKALINDQTERVVRLAERAGLEVAVQHGDIAGTERWRFAESEPDILLTTPESLEVLLSSKDSKYAFSGLRFIIVDEIHAFTESSRGVHLKCLIDRITAASQEKIIRIGLSATVGNPEDLLAWFSDEGREKALVSIPSPPSKKHFSFILEKDFLKAADAAAAVVRGRKALIFVDSRSFAERLYKPLSESLPQVYMHHSAVSSAERKAAEASFEGPAGSCVICTSTMELGIDIGNLDLVVNIGPPISAASFLQRLGRTGRRGKPAEMVFVLRDACELLTTAAAIEAASRHESEPLSPPECPYDVLLQQLLVLVKSKGGISGASLIRSLRSLSPFSQIPERSLSYLLRYLIENGYLFRDGNLLFPGTRAETEFGHSNWKALLSVLSDSGGYTAVLPDGTVVGTLDPRFVAGDAGKVFSFTGKTWRLLFRDDVHHRALIEPSDISRGLKQPFWSGEGGTSRVTRLVAKSCGIIVSRGYSTLPIPADVKEALDDLLSALPRTPQDGGPHIRIEPEGDVWDVVISTFAGDEINRLITLFLKKRLPAKLYFRTTPYAVRISGFPVKEACLKVSDTLGEITRIPMEQLAEELPPVPDTMWKFTSLLPPEMKQEMAVRRYYHLEELCAFLNG